jgi:hypothetical protein
VSDPKATSKRDHGRSAVHRVDPKALEQRIKASRGRATGKVDLAALRAARPARGKDTAG